MFFSVGKYGAVALIASVICQPTGATLPIAVTFFYASSGSFNAIPNFVFYIFLAGASRVVQCVGEDAGWANRRPALLHANLPSGKRTSYPDVTITSLYCAQFIVHCSNDCDFSLSL